MSNMKFYRFSDYLTEPNIVNIAEEHFNLIKETPCGYWISNNFIASDLKRIGKIEYEYCRWVSKTARKRFAYPDRKQALESFLTRKEKQIKILKARLVTSEKALDKAKVLLNNFEE